MWKELLKKMYKKLNIDDRVIALSNKIEEKLRNRFLDIDRISEHNQIKVLNAMNSAKLSDTDFDVSTGYGYNDMAREKLEKVYSNVFNTQAALVRPNLISGTHALAVALFSMLRPNDELLSPVGAPYDTLEQVIGIREAEGSLKEYGISYRQVELLEDSRFDYAEIEKAINENTKVVTIQRSKGYSTRKSFSVEEIGKLISFIKKVKPSVICMVDNCYGEFVEKLEPTDVGADLMVGSLIKNPGGGLAPIGGYIVGKENLVNGAAYRLSAPGLGIEVGASLGIAKAMLQGLFLAPSVVGSALKTAIFAANMYEELGFKVVPNSSEARADIIQSVVLGEERLLLAFCKGIQKASPVDSHVVPIGAYMPGYEDDVVMAAGTFIQGASIELSADGPIRPPYAVYFQGGITWFHGKYGIMMSLDEVLKCGVIK